VQVIIIFALVCCLSVFTVSSKWVEEDEVDTDLDAEFDDFGEEVSKDAADKKMFIDEILDKLIAAAADLSPKCGKVCKRCKSGY